MLPLEVNYELTAKDIAAWLEWAQYEYPPTRKRRRLFSVVSGIMAVASLFLCVGLSPQFQQQQARMVVLKATPAILLCLAILPHVRFCVRCASHISPRSLPPIQT